TSASAMTRRIAASGVVKVSLRRSTGADGSGGIAGQVYVALAVAGHAHPVANTVLGVVESSVGGGQQLLRRGGVVGVGAAAYADRKRHRRAAAVDGHDQRLHRRPDLLGDAA